jgi:hypothetical protein
MSVETLKLIAELQAAISELTWMSESDYPWRVLVAADALALLDDKTQVSLTDQPLKPYLQGVSVEPALAVAPEPSTLATQATVVDVDAFFAPATQIQAGDGPEERAIAQRYQQLVQWLKAHLTNLTVYRQGDREIDIYILGQTPEGQIMGLQTRAIET